MDFIDTPCRQSYM